MAEAKTTEAKAPKTKIIVVEPVYGPMVNLIKNIRIDGRTELAEIDGWTQSQIDAGKLKLVE